MYGGRGPEIFFPKPNTEFVQVSRSGHIMRSVDVPMGKQLTIDSYISDVPVEICISYMVSGAENSSLVLLICH